MLLYGHCIKIFLHRFAAQDLCVQGCSGVLHWVAVINRNKRQILKKSGFVLLHYIQFTTLNMTTNVHRLSYTYTTNQYLDNKNTHSVWGFILLLLLLYYTQIKTQIPHFKKEQKVHVAYIDMQQTNASCIRFQFFVCIIHKRKIRCLVKNNIQLIIQTYVTHSVFGSFIVLHTNHNIDA